MRACALSAVRADAGRAWAPGVRRVGRASAAGAALALLAACAPHLPPPKAVERAELVLVRSADDNARQVVDGLDPAERADLLNSLAWFDERPGEVVLTRGRRGRIARLTGTHLAYDFAPDLAPEPSRRRAEAFFERGGLGRTLLALSRADEVRFARRLLGRDARYLFEQYHAGRRVLGARAVLSLDELGRLNGLEASLVGGVAARRGRPISEGEAVSIAIENARRQDPRLWQGAAASVAEVERVVFDLLASRDQDRFRFVYRVTVGPEGELSPGLRDVVVDELSGEVLASDPRARLSLDGADQLWLVDGEIGCERPLSVRAVWQGGDACAAAADPPLAGTADQNDREEAAATLCETERLFAARGAEYGSADFHDWIDSTDSGVVIGMGALPRLSIGVNLGAAAPRIILAAGTARAEVIGHELAHSLFGPGGGLSEFTGGRAQDIEEHMADVLGALLERRFALRRENDCLQADDPQTLDAVGAVARAAIPCRGQRLAWRNLCEPWRNNGGWCEGARTFLDLAESAYDLGYGDDLLCGLRVLGYARSHTDLGIGNRPIAALMGAGTSAVEGFGIHGVDAEAAERLFLGAATGLPRAATWSSWGRAWIEAAREIDESAGPRPPSTATLERNVRSAVAAARVWSLPRPLQAGRGPLAGVDPDNRPAVASLVLPDGRERTYLFFQDPAGGNAVRYVWRNEVAAGGLADDSPTAFTGPCTLSGASTAASPAAVGRDGHLFVAWSEPAAEAGTGTVTGVRLRAEDAAVSGCGDGWEAYSPGSERRLAGAPALAIWRAKRAWDPAGPRPEQLVRCDPRPQSPFGSAPTAFGAAARGFPLPRDLVFELCSFLTGDPPTPRPLPPEFTVRFRDLVLPVLTSPAARAKPSVLDPRAPSWVLEPFEKEHDLALDTAFRTDPQLAERFSGLMAEFGLSLQLEGGPTEPTSLEAAALPSPDFVRPVPRFYAKYYLPGELSPPSLVFHPSEDRLVLAFRDPENRLRVVGYEDPTETDSPEDGTPQIPVLAEDVNPTDPALASVWMHSDQDYLVALYGVRHGERPTGLAYRTMPRATSGGTWGARSFTAERRIDQIRGRRSDARFRRIDYAYARTFHAPAVAGGQRVLYLAVRELWHRSAAADGRDLPGYDPFPDSSGSLSEHLDHVRYAELSVGAAGELWARGERPVRLDSTAIQEGFRSNRTQVGALQVPQHRRLLRFYFPNGSEVGVRSMVRAR